MMMCLLALPLLMGGCDDTKRALGFSKRSPDEFKVLTNPPLSMPQAYELKAPAPGTVSPQHEEVKTRAQKALAGGTLPGADGLTSDEEAFLSKAGTSHAKDDIRLKLYKEQGKDEKSETLWRKFVEGRLLVDKKPDDEAKGDTIDPKKEAASRKETSPDIEKRPEGYLDPENDPTKLEPRKEDNRSFGLGVFSRKPNGVGIEDVKEESTKE
jgi:hypothetical protein